MKMRRREKPGGGNLEGTARRRAQEAGAETKWAQRRRKSKRTRNKWGGHEVTKFGSGLGTDHVEPNVEAPGRSGDGEDRAA